MKAGLLLLGLLFGLVPPAWSERWRFGLIGDLPYTARERAELPAMLAELGKQKLAFIAHVGDFKDSKAPCHDALFEDRRALFEASPVPFVLVPGDNEWVDCQRLVAGGYDPEERLQRLRALFWTDDRSLGVTRLALTRQGNGTPEHTRFHLGPVVFITLNIPGPNNHFGMGRQPSAEYQRRSPAVIDWLRAGFAEARQRGARGLVLLFQGNPGFRHHGLGLAHTGYREFLDTLRDLTADFSGEVVAVHGDTHITRRDQPLRGRDGRPLKNFSRVETHGSPFVGWTLGIIDTTAPRLFEFQSYDWPSGKRNY